MHACCDGRFSSGGNDAERLNLQNLPKGDGKAFKELALFREVLIPDAGESWVSSDLSAIEAKIIAFLAEEEELVRG